MSKKQLMTKEEIRSFIKENKIKDVAGIEEALKRMFSTVIEEMLEAELEEHLGYSKYDYKSKVTGNSRNGESKKTVISRYGDIQTSLLGSAWNKEKMGNGDERLKTKFYNNWRFILEKGCLNTCECSKCSLHKILDKATCRVLKKWVVQLDDVGGLIAFQKLTNKKRRGSGNSRIFGWRRNCAWLQIGTRNI